MAHPIISFVHPENSKRYFYVMDTFFNYPETIPMNLLNLMQYLGLDNFGEAEAIYDDYTKLMQDGSTMPGDSFKQTNSNIVEIIYQTVRFAEVNEAYDAVSLQLEEIFLNSKDKEEFLASYEPFIENLNLYPPYPFQYYLSFDSTFRCLHNIKKFKKFNDTLAECLKNESLELEEKKDFYKWLEGGYLLSHKALFTDIFYKLAEQNLIELASVPHIFREGPGIKKLFKRYDLQTILLRNQQDYNIHHRYTATLKTIKLTDQVKLQILSDQMHNVLDPGLFQHISGMEYYCFTNLGEHLGDFFHYYYYYNAYSITVLANYYDDRDVALYPHGLNRKGNNSSPEFHVLGIGPFDTMRLFDQNGLRTKMKDCDDFVFIIPDAFVTFRNGGHFFGRYDHRKKNYESEELLRLPLYFYLENFRYYSNFNCFFLNSGVFSMSGEVLSPQCFTDACVVRHEGPLAVKINGKWGYMDENYNMVIPPVFGLADDFWDGFARVFLYEEQYFDYDENWIQVPSWIPTDDQTEVEWDEKIFEQRFPNFPKYYWFNLTEKEDRAYKRKNEAPDIDKGVYGIINLDGDIAYVHHEKEVIYTPGSGFVFLSGVEGEIIALHFPPEGYTVDAERYDYRKFTSKYIGVDKVLTEAEREGIKVELKKKSHNDFFKLPLAAKKDEDFIFELRTEKLLSHYRLPNYLKYNERFIELALNQGELDKHRIPWAFKEKFKNFKTDNEPENNGAPSDSDDLPF